MNCFQADTLMQTALDGRLSPAERARLDAHTAHCAACRVAWEEYRRLGQTATDWARRPARADDPGDAFTALVMAQIAPSYQTQRPRFHAPQGLEAWGLSACAFALLALSLWAGPLLSAHLPAVPALSVPSPATLLAPDSLGQTLEAPLRAALALWQTLTTRPAAPPAWAPGALAAAVGLNAAFVWRARRSGPETAAR